MTRFAIDPAVFSRARDAMAAMVAEGWTVPECQRGQLLAYGLAGACAGVPLAAGWRDLPADDRARFFRTFAAKLGEPPRVGAALDALLTLGAPGGPAADRDRIYREWETALVAAHAATLGRVVLDQAAYDRGLWWRQAAELCAEYAYPRDRHVVWVAVRFMLVEVAGLPGPNPFAPYLGIRQAEEA